MANRTIRQRNENGVPIRAASATATPDGAAGRQPAGGDAQGEGPADMMTYLTGAIRDNPMTCLLVGLGLGFVAARIFKR